LWEHIRAFFTDERIWELITAALVLVSFGLAATVARTAARRLVRYLAAKRGDAIEKLLYDVVGMPVFLLLVLLGAYVAVGQITMGDRLRLVADNGLFGLSAFVAAVYANRLLMALINWYARGLVQRSDQTFGREFLPLVQRVLQLTLFTITGLMVLRKFDVDITAVLATLGVASLAVALASRDTLANMISGLVIMVDRPFRVGDRIVLASGESGDVKEIGLRSIRILTRQNTMVVIPNSEIAGTRVTNLSYPDSSLRLILKLGVPHETDTRKVKEILQQVARESSELVSDPPAAIYVTDVGDTSLFLEMHVWIDSYTDQLDATDAVMMRITEALRENGISIRAGK